MHLQGTICGAVAARRIFALVACGALLYFALGATLPHGHAQGPDNACHVCQALHMPALAAARPDVVSTALIDTRGVSLPHQVATTDSSYLHRVGLGPLTHQIFVRPRKMFASATSS